jgi:predicted nucleic acid-binding protein
MQRYLLDTNVVSELRKPRPHGGVWLGLAQLTQPIPSSEVRQSLPANHAPQTAFAWPLPS